MNYTSLEETVLKVERLIGTVSVCVATFERKDAFSCIAPVDVAGMLENIRDNLSAIRGDLDAEVERQLKGETEA